MAQSERHRRHQRVRETPSARYSSAQPHEAVTGVLLDSDIVIEVLSGRAQTVADLRATEVQGVSTYCCPIAWAEVAAGVEAITEAFFNARGEVIIDAETGRRAGGYRLRYARSHGVEIADALVAAAASTTGLHLWALNRKHYPMEDLRLYAPPRDR